MELFGQQFDVVQSEAVSGLVGSETNEMSVSFSLTDAVNKVFSASSCCFMTLGQPSCGYTSAIVRMSESKFICFDSHSRTLSGTVAASCCRSSIS